MKYDIVLAGVGGQGVLSIAAILGVAAVEDGLHIKQAEVHGMSQRGGAVQSHFRIADRTIHRRTPVRRTNGLVLLPRHAIRQSPEVL